MRPIAEYALILLCLAISTQLFAKESVDSNAPPQPLDIGWEYHLGDFGGKKSMLDGWYANWETNWETAACLRFSGQGFDGNYIWYRLTLPETIYADASLFLPPVLRAFELYLDQELIYSYGEFSQSHESKYAGIVRHTVPLPADYAGKEIAIRVYSAESYAMGVIDAGEAAWIGGKSELILTVFRQNLDSVVLGAFFFFIGIFTVFIYLLRSSPRPKFLAWFALLAGCLGLYYVLIDPIGELLIPSLKLRYFLGLSPFFLFPIGLFGFMDHMVGPSVVMRRLRNLHIVVGVGVVLLDVINIVYMGDAIFPYMMVVIFSIVVGGIAAVRAGRSGRFDTRILAAGFIIAGIGGLFDVLVGLGAFTSLQWVSHYTFFIFVLLLGYIIERRFRRNATALQKKRQQLEESNRTLETRVDNRTAELNQKNLDLQDTLDELKHAQNQLVMKDKMASLGNLVAGVAHEVNNPVGAVNSAADVTKRCVVKINSLIDTNGYVALKEDKTFMKTISLLEQNNGVILTAGQRITEIVRSLKNFARLDEAEFQPADVHAGIDSTLTLLQHELKNKVEIIRDFGEIPQITCYPNQLNQVFMNLFINAAQAIEDKGKLYITTSPHEKHVNITVRDNGKGIDSEQIKQIFDPGFTTKGVGVGTGLGLSISYNIIQKHNGEITVNSIPGRGTTFTICLPLEQSNAK